MTSHVKNTLVTTAAIAGALAATTLFNTTTVKADTTSSAPVTTTTSATKDTAIASAQAKVNSASASAAATSSAVANAQAAADSATTAKVADQKYQNGTYDVQTSFKNQDHQNQDSLAQHFLNNDATLVVENGKLQLKITTTNNGGKYLSLIHISEPTRP